MSVLVSSILQTLCVLVLSCIDIWLLRNAVCPNCKSPIFAPPSCCHPPDEIARSDADTCAVSARSRDESKEPLCFLVLTSVRAFGTTKRAFKLFQSPILDFWYGVFWLGCRRRTGEWASRVSNAARELTVGGCLRANIASKGCVSPTTSSCKFSTQEPLSGCADCKLYCSRSSFGVNTDCLCDETRLAPILSVCVLFLITSRDG